MFLVLYIFGPAAITFLMVSHFANRKISNYFMAALELLVYATLDAAITSVILLPIKRVELFITESGIREIRYGITAFLASIVISAILGIVIAAGMKRVQMELKIKKKEDIKENAK